VVDEVFIKWVSKDVGANCVRPNNSLKLYEYKPIL
jgi:hypothetical protein